jgi:hypothetical protein
MRYQREPPEQPRVEIRAASVILMMVGAGGKIS